MKRWSIFLLPLLATSQAIVQQTNCPKNLVANTIVVAQAVATQANYPVIILACYKLDPSVFSVITGAPGTLPVLTVTGAVASGAAGSPGQIQINQGSGFFGAIAGVTEGYLTLADNLLANASTSLHGFLPKIPGNANYCLSGLTGFWTNSGCPGNTIPGGSPGQLQINSSGAFGGLSTLSEGYFTFSNVTTGNATSAAHGFLPKLSGTLTDCLIGTGVFATCPGGSGGGGGGTLTIKNSGAVVGARSILNFNPSSFYTWSILDDGININVQPVPTGIVVTYPPLQSGSPTYCASASASTSAYTCFLNPTSVALTTGEVLNWIPDVSCTSGAITFTVDGFYNGLGPNPPAYRIYQSDGSTDPGSSYFLAGEMYRIWFNGSAWLKVN